MKYFRTKEHIYKRLFIDKAIINECGWGHCDKDLNPIGETIVDQADTIEELCDGFIIVKNDKQPFTKDKNIVDTFSFKSRAEELYCDWEDEIMEHKVVIYAFIWTKGKYNEPILKSVAELNEKGDLELL